MKKIGIITIYGYQNYGNRLQNLAVQEILRERGFCAESIVLVDSHMKWRWRTLALRKFLQGKILGDIQSERIYRFLAFDRKYIKTKYLFKTDGQESFHSLPEYDYFAVGSDQVWNMTTVPSMIPSRFLDFGDPNAIRFSFAASIENMKYTDEQKEYVKQQLQKFKGISLREKSACDFIESFTGFQTKCLLDPVFLFDKSEWKSISKEPRIKGPYILCYQVLSNKLMQKVVNKLKKETGYPVVAICNVPFKWIRADYSFFDVSPEEFLGLYNNAACVVTTSFHGTAFGVLFNKTTYTIPKSISSNRIFDLMHLMGLDEYVVTDVKTMAKKPIDWNKVNEVIERERESSVGFLHEMMG